MSERQSRPRNVVLDLFINSLDLEHIWIDDVHSPNDHQSVELAELSQAQQDLISNAPIWVTIAFAIAVFSGVIGCLGLLLKRKWAKPILLISLIAVIAQMSNVLFTTNAIEIIDGASALMPISIIIVSVFLVLFSNYSIKKGWLK